MKRPSFQFYPGDWLQDAALRTVSIGARGLWIEMLCYMHQGSTYGVLKVNHKVILPANLARMIGATLSETEGWLEELKDAGVYSVDSDGAIFSKRMIRDEEIRKARAAGGKLGGNPKLKQEKKDNLQPNLPPTPSSSSSSSSSLNSKDGAKDAPTKSTDENQGEEEFDPVAFIFDAGTRMLGDKNRGLLGKARKQVGDQRTTEILASMAAMKPPCSEPVAYFMAAITPKVRGLVV